MTQAPQRLRSRSTGGSGGPGEAVPPGDPLLHPRSRAAPTPGSLRLIRTQDRAPARGIERREPEGEGGRSGRTSTAECGPERVQARGSLSAAHTLGPVSSPRDTPAQPSPAHPRSPWVPQWVAERRCWRWRGSSSDLPRLGWRLRKESGTGARPVCTSSPPP